MPLHARAGPTGQPVWLIPLFLFSFALTAAAAAHQQQQQGSEPIQSGIRIPAGGSRHMLQSAFCPDGCAPGQCQQDSTSGALRCAQCLQNLLVSTVDGVAGLCTCPPGKYAAGDSCVDCEKGFFCKGGKYAPATAGAEATPVRTACPTNMTTLGKRRSSIFSCVNAPGTYYVAGATANDVSAVTCPQDTYGPGLRKQRGCVPCPTGFITQGRMAQTTPSACVVPAGYYLKQPGQVAPCPAGEWKSGVGASGNCTKCTIGATTQAIASVTESECKVLTPGYYAQELASDGTIKSAALCPWGYFCPGGTPRASFSVRDATALLTTEPTIKRCPFNAWTIDLGATSGDACMTPPGYYTTPEGDTLPCPDASWRAEWKAPAEATSCLSCGTGVMGSKTDRITSYNVSTGLPVEIPVQTSADDCYIQAGQGLYYETLTKTWRVQNCDTNNYGVHNITYGLTPSPCRDCPANLVASRATGFSRSASFFTSNADGTGGFNSVMACVTTAGYGYNARTAQKCNKGYWNDADNYDTCKPCPRGTTTAGPGAGKSAADCKVAPGFSATGECPIGSYQDSLGINGTSPITCTACPTGRTTLAAGADSVADCNFCSAGWGGANCSQPCGGTGINATYGPAGRNILSPDCLPCSDKGQTVTFSFNWNEGNDIFTPGVVARIGAASPVECLAEYSQIVDSSYYIPLYSDLGVTTHENVASYAACVQLCTNASCQLVTYDYVSRQCFVRVSTAPVYEGMPWLALKVLPSGYIGTSPASVDEIAAKSLSTGMYTFYQEPDAVKVGDQVPAPGRDSFNSVGDCLKACDNEGIKCSGVTVLSHLDPLLIGRSCSFVRANIQPGVFRRTMIRADLNRLLFPSSFLCPSGYTQDATGTTPCTPLTTPAVVYLILRAQQACSQDLIDSVRTSLLNFLTDPNTAFGAYAPTVVVTVACYDVPVGQGGARRLLGETYADLVVVIEYQGQVQAGEALVEVLEACTGNCTIVADATVLDAGVQSGTQQDAPASVVALERLDTPPGDPYQFRTTYSTAGELDNTVPSPVTLNTLMEPDSMLCSVQQGGTGVALFTCRPLKALPAVTLTALAPNRQNEAERVSASVTVLNTTCLNGSIPLQNQTCKICDRGTYAPAQALSCALCDTGFTTETIAAFSVAQCNWCLPGRETSNCTVCPVGKFTADPKPANTATCTECSILGAGFTTDGTGQTSCEKCMSGYYGPSCLPAPKGTWSEGGFRDNTTFTNCSTGYTTAAEASTEADCNLCVAGYGGQTCQPCDKGAYSDEGPAVTTTCQQCDTGYTTAGTTSAGQTSCSLGAAGTRFYHASCINPPAAPSEPSTFTGTLIRAGPGGNHSTLSAAVAAASSGDRIQVLTGTITETSAVSITKSLEIFGTGSSCIVRRDSSGTVGGPVLSINANNVYVHDLAVVNMHLPSTETIGGQSSCITAATMTEAPLNTNGADGIFITRCAFTFPKVGVSIDAAGWVVKDCVFTPNSDTPGATLRAMAPYGCNKSPCFIKGNTFNNPASDSGRLIAIAINAAGARGAFLTTGYNGSMVISDNVISSTGSSPRAYIDTTGMYRQPGNVNTLGSNGQFSLYIFRNDFSINYTSSPCLFFAAAGAYSPPVNKVQALGFFDVLAAWDNKFGLRTGSGAQKGGLFFTSSGSSFADLGSFATGFFANNNVFVPGSVPINAAYTDASRLPGLLVVEAANFGDAPPQPPLTPAAPGPAAGLLVVDGVQSAAGDVVFAEDTCDAVNSGLFVASSGTWGRTPSGFLAQGQDAAGATIEVGQGFLYGGTSWEVNNAPGAGLVGLDALSFSQVSP